MCKFNKWHNIAQIYYPTLTDSDDVLLSDEDFPILLLSFVDLFCTHFQILPKSMRNNLVYIITFSIPEYACTPFFDASFICVFTIMRPTDATNNYSTYLWCSSHLLWNVVCKTFFLNLSTWHFLFESVTSLKNNEKKNSLKFILVPFILEKQQFENTIRVKFSIKMFFIIISIY